MPYIAPEVVQKVKRMDLLTYLKGRGIDTELIDFCIKTGRVYESEYHHNAVFVGMDQAGKPKYASLRGIATDFIGKASGSDKNYSFSVPADSRCSMVRSVSASERDRKKQGSGSAYPVFERVSGSGKYCIPFG